MPRAPDARPDPIEVLEMEGSAAWQHHDAEPPAAGATELAVTFDAPKFRPEIVAPMFEGPPTATGTDLSPVRPAKVARVLTPEQIAHREKVFASAREQLDYSDRFFRLKE